MTLPVSKPHCSKHLSHHEMRPGTNPTWDDHDKTFQMHEDVDDEIIHKSLHVQRPEVLNKHKNVWLLSAHSILLVLVRNRVYDWIILSHVSHHTWSVAAAARSEVLVFQASCALWKPSLGFACSSFNHRLLSACWNRRNPPQSFQQFSLQPQLL